MKTIHLPCKNKPLHLSECSDCDELAYRVGQLEECCDLVKSKLTKLDTIQEGAEVNVQSNWDDNNPNSDAYILNKPNITVDEALDITSNNPVANSVITQALGAIQGGSATLVQASLTSAGWNATTTQTIAVQGVTASNLVFVCPIPAHLGTYTRAGIYCTGQSTNSLTFSCRVVPSTNIDIYVVLMETV